MSRIVYFDCASGAAGDMLLGAVVDLGLPVERLCAELARLRLAGYRLEAERVARAGLAATRVHVVADAPETTHRHLRHVLEILERSTLEPTVQERATALFRRLAEAEAAVHGSSPESVHFHETGALTPEDLAAVQQQVRRRVLRWFARAGPLDPADARDMAGWHHHPTSRGRGR